MPLDGLNKEQLDAASELERHCSVVSIPGSGKTKMVIAKIGHIFKINPNTKIGAVTFTKKAANEMRERVLKTVDEKIIKKNLLVKTFNSMGLHQLKLKYKTKARSALRIIESWEKAQIGKNGVDKLGLDITPADFIDKAEAVKILVDKTKVSKEDMSCFEFYQDSLKQKHAIDFTDQILLAVEGMEDGSVPVPKFDYLMVDEFQDSNELQLKWLDLIIEKSGAIVTIVGDDDQSIYSFTGGLGYKGILYFEKKHNARRIVMDINYRSKEEILYHSEKLISRNKERVPKNFRSFHGKGGVVKWLHCKDESEVSNRYIEIISSRFGKDVKNYGDFAIIGRTNDELAQAEMILRAFNIPSFMHGGGSFSETFVFKFFISLLRSADCKIEDGIIHALNAFKVNDFDIAALRHELNGNLLNAIRKDSFDYPCNMNSKNISKCEEVFSNFRAWRHQLCDDNINMAITGITEFLIQETSENYEPSIKTVSKLLKKIKGSIGRRILRLKDMFDKEETDGNAVHLITAHSSKGLEFPICFILGSNQYMFPLRNHDENAQSMATVLKDKPFMPLEHLKEERRLYFVAMTRAEKELYLMSASEKEFVPKEGSSKKKSDKFELEISQFIPEADLIA